MEKNQHLAAITEGVFSPKLSSLFDALADMIENDISEKKITGGSFRTINGAALQNKYDFSIRIGLENSDTKQKLKKPVVVIPQADVTTGAEGTTVTLEMPGISVDKLTMMADRNTLSIEGQGESIIYKKEIVLDIDADLSDVQISEQNSIFKIIIKNPRKNYQ